METSRAPLLAPNTTSASVSRARLGASAGRSNAANRSSAATPDHGPAAEPRDEPAGRGHRHDGPDRRAQQRHAEQTLAQAEILCTAGMRTNQLAIAKPLRKKIR
jgi:hypothetical protein